MSSQLQYDPIDMQGLSIDNRSVQPLAAAPSSPKLSQEYFDTVKSAYGICTNATGPVWIYFSGTNTGDQTITLTGDVTGSGTGSFAATVAANAVTYAKFQQVAAASLVGNPTGSTANAQGITLGSGLSFSGTTLVATGSGGTVTAVSVATANGFAGSSSGGATPILTLTTTQTGILKGNGTAISAATAGTDYLTPSGNGSALTGMTVSQISGAAPLASPALTGTPTAPTATAGDNTTTLATTAFVTAAVSLLAQGLQPKPTARLATAAALPANTYANGTSGVGATLTGNSNGALSVDGVAVAAADIVLVKNEATGANNGLYNVTQAGSGGTPYILTRNIDMDTTGEFVGAHIVVENPGTANANTFWLCTNTTAPTVGTTAITFSQLNGATSLIAGTGITISGNTISVATTYAGGSSIATVGTITSGIWTGTTIAIANGGTGATTAAGARTNLGAPGRYSATFGDGSSLSYTVTQATHGLRSDDQMIVQISDATSGNRLGVSTSINPANGTVTITYATGLAPATNAHRITLLG